MNNRSMRTKSLNAIKYVALATMMFHAPALASTTPANAITPFSWSQFKAVYGLPSTPTVPDNSAQIDTFNGTVTASDTSIVAGEQLRAYRIGNYGITAPPSGSNNFLDGATQSGIGDTIEDWAAPFYGSSSASAQDITVDDDNALNSVSLSNLVTSGIPPASSTVTSTSVYGGFNESSNWTNVSAATADGFQTQNFNGDSYQIIPAVSRLASDASDNGVSPNYAHWVPSIKTAGFYTAYAYFPSEQLQLLSGTGVNPEPHATDARYTIYIQLPGQPLNKFQVTINQQTGGSWVPLGPAHYFPETDNDGQFPTPAPTDIGYAGAPTEGLPTTDTNAFVDIRVDNTTANSTTTTIGSGTYQRYIVADAIQLRGGDGQATRTYGTPVAVNITAPILTSQEANSLTDSAGSRGDYSEIALGYGGGAPTGDGKTGGKPIRYQTDVKQTGAPYTGDFFPSTTNPQVFAGSVGYDSTLPSTPVTQPIDQVVYFTRTESIQVNPNDAGQTEQVGYVYAVNGQSGDVIWRYPSTSPLAIGDIDTTDFLLNSGTWTPGANASSSFNNEAYDITPAVGYSSGSTASATWTPTQLATGNYFVYAYFPSQGNGEKHVASAHYTINASDGISYSCYVNQQTGGQWVQLQNYNATTHVDKTVFPVTSASTVVLTNDTTDFASVNTNGEVVSADAIEFVPTQSMGTIDSSPAVVRNMKVYDQASGTDISRSVIIATDNLGKVYCIDASGNGDGDDTLYDANNDPVYIDTAGQGFEDMGLSIPAPTPWHPKQYGTTSVYWIWQPNALQPISSSEIVDDSDTLRTTSTGSWTASTTSITGAYLNNIHTDSSLPRTPSGTYDDFTWIPTISGGNAGQVTIFVSVGQNDGNTHADDARYTVVDASGTAYQCQGVNQTVTVPGFVQLVSLNGQSVFNFSSSPIAGSDEVFLDNSTTDTDSPEIIADAVEFIFNGQIDANSNLIAPLAFQTCSPTVHVVPDSALTVPSVTNATSGTTINYDAYDAKIYVGNSNGVLYALDGQGYPDGGSLYQRDLSQDPNMPSPSVDWWFNVGVRTEDTYGEIEDNAADIVAGIAGAPAYYHAPANTTSYYDQILFTTYSPEVNGQGGVNVGNLYSVNAIGPVGDYGAGIIPDQLTNFATTYPSAAATYDYNLTPIPQFSFPDAYGSPHLPNSSSPISLPSTDHIVTSLVAPTALLPNIVPAAHSLGDSAGSPVVFGGVSVPSPINGAAETLPYHAYFVANDPTVNESQPAEGRLWGVNLTPGTTFGTVDSISGYPASNGVSTFVYPFVVPPSGAVAATNGGSFDPNSISTTDNTDISAIYDSSGSTTDTQPFGPFTDGPTDVSGSSNGYYVSSSPAAAVVHTIANGSGNTLTPTLTAGVNPLGGNYPVVYGSSAGAYDIDIPALYVGDLDGVLHTINLAGYSDDSRFLQDVTLDGSPILSTPCVLANGNGDGTTAGEFGTSDTGGNNAGGVVFSTTESGSLWESEGLPFIESGLTIARGVDYEFGGPGGYSGVAASSFNINNFSFTPVSTSAEASEGVDTSEWIYAAGDAGFTYGIAPENTARGNGATTGNPGGFNPGAYINPEGIPTQNTIPLDRNIITAVLPNPPTYVGGKIVFSPTAGRPPLNNAFDWGQTVYIVFYGLDDPTAGSSGGNPASGSYPRGMRLFFSISPQGSAAGAGLRGGIKSIDLQAPGNAVQVASTNWPPNGFTVETPTGASTTSTDPSLIGPYAAVYAYQLGKGSSTDPQTPASIEKLLNIKEQILYFPSNSGSPINATINARTDTGTVVRVSNGSGGYKDEQTPAVDQATFSILNPLAVRTAGRSMGTISGGNFTYWDLTLVPSNYSGSNIYSLGPFSGADPTTFSTYQAADGNGDNVPQTAPLGGSITLANGTTLNPNDPAAGQIPRPKTIDVTLAVSLGLINHGSNGISSTPNSSLTDPTASFLSSGDAPSGPAVYGTVGANPDTSLFGESLLNIADRSALGDINESLTTISENGNSLQWNDNSGAGGEMAVVNPLPWEQMPTSFTTLGAHANNSRDYPDMPAGNTNMEVLPRLPGDYNIDTTAGTDTYITNTTGTLAAATPDGSGNAILRTINPNAALVRIAVPKYQPANLDSYDPESNPGILEPGSTRASSNVYASNVGQGYEQSTNIYVKSGANRGFNRNRDANRTVQVWTSVPADLSTKIVEQTIDVGSVPAGFGIDLTSNGATADNSSWLPFQVGSNNSTISTALNPFYRPITILNEGNTNLVNLHLNQYNYLNPSSDSTAGLTMVPNPFGSFATSSESLIPSYDVGGVLTGTTSEPILRSSLDYDLPAGANAYYENPFIAGQSVVPPGPTAHKSLVGDPSGAVVSVPDIPHNNLGNGATQLNSRAYNGRPVISLAVPLATPVGKYSQTVSSFEGADYGVSADPYLGPTYGGLIYSRQGWWVPGTGATTGSAPIALNGLEINLSANTTYQNVSNPSTTVTVNVVEDRMTDGTPLPVTSSSGVQGQAVSPMTDPSASTTNSNDLQPWAFYLGGTSPSVNLLWTSARAGLTTKPYSIYESYLPLNSYAGSGGGVLPSYPLVASGAGSHWWSPASAQTETTALPSGVSQQQSYGASTFSYSGQEYALWVTSDVYNNTPEYTLCLAEVTTAGIGGTTVPLFTSTVPIFSPRAAYYNSAVGVTGFTPPASEVGTAYASTVAQLPLIVYYTHQGGRSSLMYWPAAGTVNSQPAIVPAEIPVPQELTAVANPSIVARAYATNNLSGSTPVSQVDITYSGQLAPNKYADICTGRYTISSNSTTGTATLTAAATLPPVTFTPTAPATLTLPTVDEPLTPTIGTSTWQARDIGWYRDPGAFQLNVQCKVGAATDDVALVPGGSAAVYDHASGQWVFSIDWAKLLATYTTQTQLITDLATWWTGSTSTNVIVYSKPGSGLVTFNIPPPVSKSSISTANSEVYTALYVNIDPTILRTTFMSESNTSPITFIDDQYKTNAANGLAGTTAIGNVIPSRYWYIYRKQAASGSGSSASASVLYYNTRRLTLVLTAISSLSNTQIYPTPIQLTDNGTYSLPSNFGVKDSGGNDVTSQVDVDWARGRIYFPQVYTVGMATYPSEGTTFTVTYSYFDNTQGTGATETGTYTGVASWMDEPLFNSTSSLGTVGEHVLPINTPTNETEPSAFLDPNAGLGGTSLALNPSSVTPTAPNGQPYPHKVWVFWTSNRNASNSGGTGSDVYWETIDPRFEVINP